MVNITTPSGILQIKQATNDSSGNNDGSGYPNPNASLDEINAFLGRNMNAQGLHNNLGEYVLSEYEVYLMGFEPIQGNYPFTHEDRSPYSIFTRHIETPDNLLIVLLALKAWRDKDAFKQLIGLMESYAKATAGAISDVANCGKSSYGANTNAIMLASAMAHKAGLINDAGVVRVQEHLRGVFDKLFELDIFSNALNSVTTLVEGTKIGQGESGMGQSGLSALLSTLKV